MTPHSSRKFRPVVAGVGATLLLMSSSLLAAVTPEVLYRFSNSSGMKPASPPVRVESEDRAWLFGVSPPVSSVLVSYYTYPLSGVEDDFAAADLPQAGTGSQPSPLVTDGERALFLINPTCMGETCFGDPDVYAWRSGEEPASLITSPENPAEEYGSDLRPRGVPALDAQGNLYFGGGGGSSGNGLFRLSPEGQLVELVDFDNHAEGRYYPLGQRPIALLIDQEENVLYGLAGRDQSDGVGDSEAIPADDESMGTLFSIDLANVETDGSTTVTLLRTFAKEADGCSANGVDSCFHGSHTAQHALLQVGAWLYGTSFNTIWRFQPDDSDSFAVVHAFGEEVGDGRVPWGPLVLAADGNLYGTTRRTVAEEGAVDGAGVLFRVRIGQANDRSDDEYEVLHVFDVEADGALPAGLSAGAVDGTVQTLYGATSRGGRVGNTVSVNDADGFGTLFAVDIDLPVLAEIEISADPQTLTLGESTTLTWSVSNANNCSGEDDWAGVKATEGSEIYTPSVDGEYVLTLACVDANDDRVEASVTVTVEPAEDGGDGDGDNGGDSGGGSSGGGGGGALSLLWLSALGLLTVRHRRRFSL